MSSPTRGDARPALTAAELEAALKDFVTDITRHSRKNAETLDVLVHAVRAVHQDLQQEKVRTHVLETRLKKTEASLDRLARLVEAIRRQGWVQ